MWPRLRLRWQNKLLNMCPLSHPAKKRSTTTGQQKMFILKFKSNLEKPFPFFDVILPLNSTDRESQEIKQHLFILSMSENYQECKSKTLPKVVRYDSGSTVYIKLMEHGEEVDRKWICFFNGSKEKLYPGVLQLEGKLKLNKIGASSSSFTFMCHPEMYKRATSCAKATRLFFPPVSKGSFILYNS